VANIVVTPLGPGKVGVQVGENSELLSYVVTVPAGLADSLGLGDVEETELVRAAFVFLLDHEPASSIMKQFSLDVVPTYFPDFYEDLVATLGRD
jgi:hypothetical protein